MLEKTDINFSKLLNRYGEDIENILKPYGVVIENKPNKNSNQLSLTASGEGDLKEFDLHVYLGERPDEKVEIAYTRKVRVSEYYPDNIRAIASKVGSVHECSSGLRLQTVIDQGDGFHMVNPGLSFGGNFRLDDYPNVLKLLALTDHMIDLFHMGSERSVS